PFSDWARASFDLTRWSRYTARLEEHSQSVPDRLSRALEIATRAAAVDTGAIEGLYEVDRGFTFTVATQAAAWEVAANEKGPRFKALLESQLRAYDTVLDLATKQVRVAEAWIRGLQAEICRGQETYLAYTEIGPQEQRLPLGEYKVSPNHVLQKDGTVH